MTVLQEHDRAITVRPFAFFRPAPWNPRFIKDERYRNLVRSLQADPAMMYARPLLCMADGTVYGGNMRLRALGDLGAAFRRQHYGIDGAPSLVEDIALEAAKARAIRDNGSWGDWQDQELAEILHGLDAQGVDVQLLGFTTNEIERLLALVGAGDVANDDDFDPTPPPVPQSRTGDVYLLGPHRLVCGSSADARSWDLLFEEDPAARADAMWTDPPYGVDLQVRVKGLETKRKAERTIAIDAFEGDKPEDVAPLLALVFPLVDAHLRPGAPYYIAGPHGRMARIFEEAIVNVGWYHAQTLVWVKSSFVPGRADYHYQHEAVFYGWKQGAAHSWLGAPDKSTVIDDEPDVQRLKREEMIALIKTLRNDRHTDVIREDKTRHNDLHPTMKPPKLIRTMLANSTIRGAIVVEPFAGSGSTMVAAHTMLRRAFMIELEPKFADVIVRRWRELVPGNKATRIRDGVREEDV